MIDHIPEKKINFFRNTLLRWYEMNGRKFHWRKKGLTHYQYVIAEVLLQRTKAETVAPFYLSFIKNFPNWKVLARSRRSTIAKYLKPIGLYNQRAERLIKLAMEMDRRGGRLPKDRATLETIPFMGQYLANAVELVIFNHPSPLMDVNMARVLERFFGPRTYSDIRYDPYLQNLSRTIVTHPESKELNWAILDFAALVCKARSPKHEECPLNKQCCHFMNIKKLEVLAD